MIDSFQSRAQKDAEYAAKKNDDFQRFMAKSETKLLLSLIPQGDQPEVVETVLRTAFEAGYGAGQGEAIAMIVETMFKDKKA